MTPDPMPRPTEDELLARYHEAVALQGAGPGADLRAAVLAQAEVTAWKHADAAENPDEIAIEQIASSSDTASAEAEFASELPLPAAAAAEAANDRRWFIPAVASVAVLGLAALLALQFDRGDPADQAVALGQRGAPAAEVADPAPSEPTASDAVAAAPSAETVPEAAPASALPPPASPEPPAPPPVAAPAEPLRASGEAAAGPARERAAERPRPAPAAKPAPAPRAKPPAPAASSRRPTWRMNMTARPPRQPLRPAPSPACSGPAPPWTWRPTPPMPRPRRRPHRAPRR